MKVEPRVQFNKRVSGTVRTIVKLGAVVMPDITEDQILEDAVLLYFGSEDPEILNRQKQVMAQMKSLKGGKLLPFESPLIPTSHNAADNGIVGVASSSLAGSTILSTDVAVTSARKVDKLKNKIKLGSHVGQIRKCGAGHSSRGIAFAE